MLLLQLLVKRHTLAGAAANSLPDPLMPARFEVQACSDQIAGVMGTGDGFNDLGMMFAMFCRKI